MSGGIFGGPLGRKLVMSISGLFLMLFLLMHLSINLTLMLNDVDMFGQHWAEGEMFNTGAHFMISIPLIRIMEPLLAAGFVFHILYATIITLKNRKFRPIGYAQTSGNALTSWSSKNMYILGLAVLAFLVLHIMNFFWKFRFTEMPMVELGGHTVDDSYSVVAGGVKRGGGGCPGYIAAAVLLALHLAHGFWSAFQTIGFNNRKWIPRLHAISVVYAIVIGLGFSSIPLYFLLIH